MSIKASNEVPSTIEGRLYIFRGIILCNNRSKFTVQKIDYGKKTIIVKSIHFLRLKFKELFHNFNEKYFLFICIILTNAVEPKRYYTYYEHLSFISS